MVVLEVEVAAALDAAASVALPDREADLARDRLAAQAAVALLMQGGMSALELALMRRSRSTTSAMTSPAVRSSSSQ